MLKWPIITTRIARPRTPSSAGTCPSISGPREFSVGITDYNRDAAQLRGGVEGTAGLEKNKRRGSRREVLRRRVSGNHPMTHFIVRRVIRYFPTPNALIPYASHLVV